ncbi:YjcZ family sporulation protein [Bacillus horti]|uniref:Uncharacterized protein (TIGR01732 family) n=1 Tax=Caldalkalibacillus horti TaxID=77523 RepID=A0ABT9VY38_9BACI|nr:YjcZ family sporulation protein [Bacillus horti]MDQ0165799.1 uncharacterized protein (TIGR01732 family) [Bacillus horti]
MGGFNFPLIVVLFVLLIIVGCGCMGGYGGPVAYGGGCSPCGYGRPYY